MVQALCRVRTLYHSWNISATEPSYHASSHTYESPPIVPRIMLYSYLHPFSVWPAHIFRTLTHLHIPLHYDSPIRIFPFCQPVASTCLPHRIPPHEMPAHNSTLVLDLTRRAPQDPASIALFIMVPLVIVSIVVGFIILHMLQKRGKPSSVVELQACMKSQKSLRSREECVLMRD